MTHVSPAKVVTVERWWHFSGSQRHPGWAPAYSPTCLMRGHPHSSPVSRRKLPSALLRLSPPSAHHRQPARAVVPLPSSFLQGTRWVGQGLLTSVCDSCLGPLPLSPFPPQAAKIGATRSQMCPGENTPSFPIALIAARSVPETTYQASCPLRHPPPSSKPGWALSTPS